ncbi:hypothetical protein N836_35905 [Leptolyngbya sp. Heron Island J]|uniref:hypothetical protein n=1 Tax=Leptolyngbya sp. Heron Island J TaxID=1385935 RepID=UPI0003B98A89|nr:hypothetical protein [Leptolyngbya sp. Heron Island J]ESA37759.1 hypothetical protein N836_35905 [Leptolyngbya sp. Heron Island J]
MDPGTATLVASLIGAIAVVASAIITKYDLYLVFSRSRINISGEWRGYAVYVAGEFSEPPNAEALYRVNFRFNQIGSLVFMEARVVEVFDIYVTQIPNSPARFLKGKGHMLRGQDIVIAFANQGSLTCGTIYFTLNTFLREMDGIVALRNPLLGKPVAVKILLRRESETPVQPEDLNLEPIRTLIESMPSA